MTNIAIIQLAPVLLDRKATLERAVAAVEQAADDGAQFIIFPEAFVSGYPSWIWRLRAGTDGSLVAEIHARMWSSAVDLARDDLAPLRRIARDRGLTIACGLNEKGADTSYGTLYNTLVLIDTHGDIRNRHRKMMPTNPERMVWGMGDGSGLNVLDTPVGRIGGLICWENYMPLARHALYAQGIEIYLAPTYDSGSEWLETMGHIAREGRCWVLNCGSALHGTDIPADFPSRKQLFPDDDIWINPGDSAVFAPGGAMVAGPLHEEQGILHAEIDAEQALLSRRALDVCGHYSRPDIFSLHVDATPRHTLERNPA